MEESDDKGRAWSRHKQWLLACRAQGTYWNSLESPEIIPQLAEEMAAEYVVDRVREV